WAWAGAPHDMGESARRKSGPPSSKSPDELLLDQFSSALARCHLKASSKRFVKIRKVVEAPSIRNFGNVQGALSLVAKRRMASLEPVIEHPASKRLADLREARVQRSNRDAQLVCDEL